MKQQMRPSAFHLKHQEIKKLFMAAHDFRDRSIVFQKNNFRFSIKKYCPINIIKI